MADSRQSTIVKQNEVKAAIEDADIGDATEVTSAAILAKMIPSPATAANQTLKISAIEAMNG